MHLEHVNITVPDPKATAKVLCGLFDWTVRWEGAAINGGYSVHVGNKDSYLALYTPGKKLITNGDPHYSRAGLNHIGIVVEDLDDAEAKVSAAGYATFNHADYEPGKRFYFDGPDDIEYEVVSYA
ncbi:VOC family protein [Actibacterium pelagium]|uniref:VOC domain-containing protein n=1 Tax=Actibacterium pelagium TaxID=2029103 RepID=A0A917ABS8_9RHOB|nr:VOC family protein [Actibacterium pelagium]GGE41127.1 hypothetical protein GCM10011517_05960 [Actibacterium pelagium]